MTSIPAIETRFNGTRYRSRLEARYAVFFEILGLEYHYELEKFSTEVGRYIPDFWMPTLGDWSDMAPEGAFVEVKGVDPDHVALRKASDLSEQTGKRVYFFGPEIGKVVTLWEYAYSLTQCPLCGVICVSHWDTSEYKENPDIGVPSIFDHPCKPEFLLAMKCDAEDYFNQNYPAESTSPLIELATSTAKSARFEDPEWFSGEFSSAKRFSEMLWGWKVYCGGEGYLALAETLSDWSKNTKFYPLKTHHLRLMEHFGIAVENAK